MTTEAPRSRDARALAQRAMVALFWELRDTSIRPIVLGGLVPEVLAGADREEAPDHMGTNDVDLLVAFHVDDSSHRPANGESDVAKTGGGDEADDDGNHEPDLGPLEAALKAAGLVPDPKIGGWRWIARVDGYAVKVEFLCDRDDVQDKAVIRPRGCTNLRFANLRGAGYVARDFVEENVTDRLPNGTSATVTVRFAGLQGYLLAKLAALLDRQLDKDHYDLVYVLLHHKAGTGPRGAADALLAGPFARDLPSLRNRFRELAARFSGTHDHGPAAYAKQLTLVYPDADRATLIQDAISAIQEFTAPLIEERR